MTFDVIGAPVHTLGHVMYLLRPVMPSGAPSLFTGDTIFIAGAGTNLPKRFF